MGDYACVFDYAYAVLTTNCSEKKSKLTLECYKAYKNGTLPMGNPKESKTFLLNEMVNASLLKSSKVFVAKTNLVQLNCFWEEI